MFDRRKKISLIIVTTWFFISWVNCPFNNDCNDLAQLVWMCDGVNDVCVDVLGSASQKGTVMGILRSLGALARALGPIVASSGEQIKKYCKIKCLFSCVHWM